MQKEKRIVAFLREKYRPVAIILHGSRAIGMSRSHSDWDIFLLFKNIPPQDFGREEIVEEDVEWKAIKIPATDILRTFGVQLQFGKVLWEEDDIGTTILKQAQELFAQGIQLTESERKTYRNYLTHKINGMQDDKDTPPMFLRHQYAFFERATNWWSELRGEYRKPFYIALPRIQKDDPQYYAFLMQVCGNGTNEEKIQAARGAFSHLFPL